MRDLLSDNLIDELWAQRQGKKPVDVYQGEKIAITENPRGKISKKQIAFVTGQIGSQLSTSNRYRKRD